MKMKRFTWLFLFLFLPGLIFGCGKGKETSTHQEGMKHEAKKAEEAKKGDEMSMEMKGLSMESIEKERSRRWLPGQCRLPLKNNNLSE